MQEPMCLITNEEDGGLRVEQEALAILQQIKQPVVVVSIVGLYRTGKSYLMNRLAGKQSGFALGSTVESKTKGIWMWCVPHPSKQGHTLVLLDTEGLGDVNKGDPKHDTKIFALAILLSSTLVYNSRGTIDNRTVEELQYVTELTRFIKVRSSDEEGDDSEFVKFFPNFVWTVRDFTLELKIGGQDVTGDEYLEYGLQLKKGCSGNVVAYNLPRECIRKYFPSRRCYPFPFPTNPENMSRLESLNQDELSAAFLEVAKQFCTFVFEHSQEKLMKGGYIVSGKVLGDLAKTYVDTISSGGMPCLENAVVAISEKENEAAKEDGLRLYRSGMDQLKQTFPVELQVVTSKHRELNSMAIREFMKRCFKDDEGVFMESLEKEIDEHFKQYLQNNEEASKNKCQDILDHLSADMADKLQKGSYATSGGYKLYRQDMDHIVEEYNSQTNESVKAKEVLEKFVTKKSEESEHIRQADSKLREKEKRICAEKEKAFLLEQKMEAEQEEKHLLEAKMKADQDTYEERMKQMEGKHEEEKRRNEQEFERALESKMSEQKIMLEKGFEEQAKKLLEEIDQYKKGCEEIQAKYDTEVKLVRENLKVEKQELEQRHEQELARLKQQHDETRNQHSETINILAHGLKSKDSKCFKCVIL
ncbi:guanylate-binding protein 1-like [Sardina pilchardus]|uniref:guanylate-binding protein 1-like n=1 Tax=Sardina pilchardus TaxID=27697 RepID=UPI002E0F4D96